MNSHPLCFTALVGQEKPKRILERALTSDRVPHGLIFKGPAGVGKTLFAKGFAAALNCRSNDFSRACGICISCRKYISGNHPDFTVIEPEKGVIKIGRIRALIKELTYPPYESALRVVVLEDVHTMRREAANSLLKTLEEPPAGNILILTAEASKEILSTLTSRCQVVSFTPLSMEETSRILVNHGMEQERAELFSRLADGSPGKALALEKTGLVELWLEICCFLSDPHVHVDLDVGKLLLLAGKMAGTKEDLLLLLSLFRIWLRDMLVDCRNVASGHLQDEEAWKSWSSEELFAKLRAVDRAESELARNCNRNLVCEVLLFTLQQGGHLCDVIEKE